MFDGSQFCLKSCTTFVLNIVVSFIIINIIIIIIIISYNRFPFPWYISRTNGAMYLVQLYLVHNLLNAFLVLFPDIFSTLLTIPVARMITVMTKHFILHIS